MKALGTKISELRKARGMTQDELADKMEFRRRLYQNGRMIFLCRIFQY